MKVMTNQAIYVQKYDIAYLNYHHIKTPISMDCNMEVDEKNKLEFVRFDQPEEICFLQDIEEILDYSQWKDYPTTKLIHNTINMMICYDALYLKIKNLERKELSSNPELISQYRTLGFKLYTLTNLDTFRQQLDCMELPEEIQKLEKHYQLKKMKKRFSRKN